MNAQTGGCTQPHARAESFQRISYTISFPSVSIGILEIHTSVTICGPCRSACPAAPSIWGSPTAYPRQNRRPASMERPRRQNRGSRLRPPGPAFWADSFRRNSSCGGPAVPSAACRPHPCRTPTRRTQRWQPRHSSAAQSG